MKDEIPLTADCVIVGGGVVGVSLAFRLAERGLKPVLLERSQLGNGSTARCAGGVRQQFSTEVNVRVAILSRQLLERFEEETGQTAALRQIGYLFLATDAAEASAFRNNVDLQHRVGLKEVELLEPAQAKEMVPELFVEDVVGATFCPTDGLAGPNEVTMGYASAAQSRGARIVEDCNVLAIRREGDRITQVRTARGDIATSMVVNCAGAYASQMGDWVGVEVPVKPYRRHIFVTEKSPLRADAPMVVDFRTSLYFHPEGPGLLLGMSDRDEGTSYDTSVSWDFLEQIIEKASHRVPPIADVAIKTGWAGLYEVSPDNQGIVGESAELPGFWLCCGFSGHGFMQAPAIGLLLADEMTGASPSIDISPFSPARFSQASQNPELAVI